MGIVELLIEKENRITELKELIEELMIENKQYRDALDRLNEYIRSYETAIYRFDKANED